MDPQYVAQLEVALEQRRLERQRRKQQPVAEDGRDMSFNFDDTFADIAGYTSGGAPYGLTWDQWQMLDHEDLFADQRPDDDWLLF